MSSTSSKNRIDYRSSFPESIYSTFADRCKNDGIPISRKIVELMQVAVESYRTADKITIRVYSGQTIETRFTNLPINDWRRFKALCVRLGTTPKQMLTFLMERSLER